MSSAFNSHTDAKLDFIGWKDENNAVINLTLLDSLRVSILDLDSGSFVRRSQNYLQSDEMVLTAAGRMTWFLTPHDTRIVGDTEPGDSQSRRAYVRIAWGSEREDDLLNPFTTVSGSRRVVVNHPSHGLSVTERVFFDADTDVGGLDLGTQFVVEEVLSSNSYAVLANEPATANASNAGGAVVAWIRNRAASADKVFSVVRNDPL